MQFEFVLSLVPVAYGMGWIYLAKDRNVSGRWVVLKGLLNTGDPLVPWILGAIAIAVAVGLVWWLARARHGLVVLGLGLVLGGAIGNLIDRLLYGAVVDFVLLHAGGWH